MNLTTTQNDARYMTWMQVSDYCYWTDIKKSLAEKSVYTYLAREKFWLLIPCLLSWGSIALLEPLLRGNDLPNISVDMSRWARQKSYFKNIDSSIVPFSVVVKGELICVYFCSCLLGEGGEWLRKKHDNSRAMIVELVLGRSVIKSSPL